MDEKGRIFGKVSVVDLVIVAILIVALAWFGYARFGRNLGNEASAREEPIEIGVLVMGIRETTAEAMAKSDKIFEFKTGAHIGNLKNVTSEPATMWTITDDGRWLRVKDPDRVDAVITVTGTARVGDNVITMNGVEVRVGTTVGLQSKFAAVQGNILTMNLLGPIQK